MTEPKTILDPAQAKMDKAIEFLVEALASVRAGKASTNLLNGITVDYYGNPTPVSQVASVTVPDTRTVSCSGLYPVSQARMVPSLAMTKLRGIVAVAKSE
jgi:ribosome recycling factor